MKYVFSKHALEQMKRREIPKEIVEAILTSPEQIIEQEGKKIFQSVVSFDSEGDYLIRIFVNDNIDPNVIITVYKTSKIKKYQ